MANFQADGTVDCLIDRFTIYVIGHTRESLCDFRKFVLNAYSSIALEPLKSSVELATSTSVISSMLKAGCE